MKCDSSTKRKSVSKKDKEHYSLDEIKKFNAHYNMIIGERSNGKTFACLEESIRKFWVDKEASAYIRRWKEDLRGKRPSKVFDGIVQENKVAEITNNTWNTIKYLSGCWYLARVDDDIGDVVVDNEPFMYAFALSDMEHDKSTNYMKVTTIIFDEFLTRQVYLQEEFVIFMNVLSTIIRHRNNVKIYMLANTVNKFCPYFNEMGLKHVKEQKQGTIDLYTYGDTDLKVALEYCSNISKESKKSDVYFAFDNPSLQMITGGSWELGMYPHCPCQYKHDDIIFTYFIKFDDELLQCDIIQTEESCFTFIHYKTSEIKHPKTDIIFSDEWSELPNHFRNIRKSSNKLVQKLGRFFKDDKVFYQSNDIGEIVRNYLQFCLQN